MSTDDGAEEQHRAMLQRAVDLARRSVDSGGGPFGAVVAAADGRILGEGMNRVVPGNDPTAHAEVVAIRAACQELGDPALVGATMYASCEPCPMCLGAILWARIPRLLFAADRHDAAAAGFDDSVFYEELEAPDPARLGRRHLLLPTRRDPFDAWRDFDQARPY